MAACRCLTASLPSPASLSLLIKVIVKWVKAYKEWSSDPVIQNKSFNHRFQPITDDLLVLTVDHVFFILMCANGITFFWVVQFNKTFSGVEIRKVRLILKTCLPVTQLQCLVCYVSFQETADYQWDTSQLGLITVLLLFNSTKCLCNNIYCGLLWNNISLKYILFLDRIW